MKLLLNWETFKVVCMHKSPVYISEDEVKWDLWVADGAIILHCEVIKSETSEENIMFVERNFSGRPNLVKVVWEEKPLVREEVSKLEYDSDWTDKEEDYDDSGWDEEEEKPDPDEQGEVTWDE